MWTYRRYPGSGTVSALLANIDEKLGRFLGLGPFIGTRTASTSSISSFHREQCLLTLPIKSTGETCLVAISNPQPFYQEDIGDANQQFQIKYRDNEYMIRTDACVQIRSHIDMTFHV